ncbi:MAG: lysophospholipid acyltransferase family protein [Firmicutes bacterium]|nr:lysophospholipid acyltransferase family protein [Bacillota bacterium]
MKRWRSRLIHKLTFFIFILFRTLTRVLPERGGYALGRGLGLFGYLVVAQARRGAVTNLRAALGLDEDAARRLARRCFISLGLSGAELLRLGGRPDLIKKRVRLVGEEHLRAALAAGRGVVLFTAHLGNWALCGQALSLAGYLVYPIVQAQANERVYAFIDRERRAMGLRPISRGFSLREVLRALREGGCVSIMPDQEAEKKGIFVPFFGRPALTPRGIVVAASLSGAPIVPCFFRRRRPGYHEIRLGPPVPLAHTGKEEEDLRVNLARLNSILEAEIKEHPEEWLWIYDRWRTRPQEDRPSF